MNAVYALLLLATVAFAVTPTDILPCAFEATTLTRIYSGGSELTTSIDGIYHDHDDLWRWDSEFNGIPGLFDHHVWSVIWRPDDEVSYHEYLLEQKCLINNGGQEMYPFPYEWIESKTDGINWTVTDVKIDGKDGFKYTGVTKSKALGFSANANLYILKNGQWVSGNGTLESNLIDVSFSISVTKFKAHAPITAGIFVPSSALCVATTAPMNASRDFAQYCYREVTSSSSGAVVINPSLVFLIATLLAALLIFVAV